MFASNTSAGSEIVFVENVFSTSLYSGTGSNKKITNNIDLANRGGIAWIKSRIGAYDHAIGTKELGSNVLYPNLTSAAIDLGYIQGISSFNSDGFSVGSTYNPTNTSGEVYASWTFRRQPKFFDVVTWTGDGQGARKVSHGLSVTPSFIIYKCVSAASDWGVIAQVGSTALELKLNATNAGANTGLPIANNFATNNTLEVGNSYFSGGFNVNGASYVAYLFASENGGFGSDGTGNAISCGTFTTNGSGSGSYTPNFANGTQWLTLKCSSTTGDWETYDTQRTPGWSSTDSRLRPNLANAEDAVTRVAASGSALNFSNLSASQTYIIVAVAAP